MKHTRVCQICKAEFLKRPKLSYKQFGSMKFCGRICQAKGFIGFRMPKEIVERLAKEKTGKPAPWKKGKLNWFWRGGKTPQILAERMSLKYKTWRRSVFERDNYTCVMCGDRGQKGRGKTVRLNADHIKSFTHFPKLRYRISNGRTLCVDCHKKTDTFGGKSRK